MGRGKKRIVGRSFLGLSVVVLLGVFAAASAADFPRRIAIAPFTILGPHEEIRQTVDILPQLVASRLRAMAGAQVLLLPSGEKAPAAAAKKAGLPLVLTGTVTKLGAGYSIDVTVTETDTGKMAGAFFAAAATEDEIIPRLGDLAEDISHKMFGVRAAVRPPPAPAAPPTGPPAPATAGVPAAVPHAGPSGALPAAPAPAAAAPGKPWFPSSFHRVARSDAIPDVILGVVAGDVDAQGDGDVFAYGKNAVYVYRVKGNNVLPYTQINRPLADHLLGIAAIDLDGDGNKEILVTDLVGERVESFVLKRKGDNYEEAAEKIPYYLAVLPDWKGKPAVVGQSAGIDVPFYGKFRLLHWNGKGFDAGTELPQDTDIFPLSQGLPGVSSARFDKEWKLVYTDVRLRLRIVDSRGKPHYTSQGLYGPSLDYFEWGPYDSLEERRPRFAVRKPVRVAKGTGGTPLFLIAEVTKGLLDITSGSFKSTRLVLLRWDGGAFATIAATPEMDQLISGADFLSPTVDRPGSRVVESVIEQEGNVLSKSKSRISVFRLD